MNREILFISDLHLSGERPQTTRRFLRFLTERAADAEALYILGDLFDAWIGDDDRSPFARVIVAALKALTERGTPVYFQHGNRDFLIGARFAEASGARLLADYAVVDLFGVPTLITHGDLLCTDDLAYQAFRRKARSAEWQADVLSKPLWLRRLAARWYRLRSLFEKRGKTSEIMDVNAGTVESVMREHAVTRLIHGHTHRPAVHELCWEGQSAQRFVLAEWTETGSVLVWRPTGWVVETVA